MGILLRTKKIKSMKRNNKKSSGLNIMRGGLLSAVMALFQATARSRNKLLPPVAQSTQYDDPLVSQIARQVSKTQGGPGAQTGISPSLYNKIKHARDVVINLKKNRQTFTNYKNALSKARKVKQSLKKQDLVLYKQVKKDMSKAKKQKH